MRKEDITQLLSEKLSDVAYNYTEGYQVLGFSGWHDLPDGRAVMVNVRLIDESNERDSYYRCRVSSAGMRDITEGPLMNSVGAAITSVQWADLNGWKPYRNNG